MSKSLTSIDIMDIYAKKILREAKYKKGYSGGYTLEIPKVTKSSVELYTDDIDLIPTTFQVDFKFDIIFDSQKIREEFSGAGGDEEETDEPVSTEPTSDDETEKQIQKAMSAETPGKSVRSTYVDYKLFYKSILSKKLSPFAIENKLRDMSKAGVLVSPDFALDNVTDATDSDIQQIFKAFVDKDQKNRQPSPIALRYGYSVIFVAKNQKRKYTDDDCIEVAEEFAPKFQDIVLEKTDLYDFKKVVKKAPTPEIIPTSTATAPLQEKRK